MRLEQFTSLRALLRRRDNNLAVNLAFRIELHSNSTTAAFVEQESFADIHNKVWWCLSWGCLQVLPVLSIYFNNVERTAV